MHHIVADLTDGTAAGKSRTQNTNIITVDGPAPWPRPQVAVELYIRDISRYNKARYCRQYKNFECKTSARRLNREILPYLALTGKLWLSCMSHLGEIEREV